MVKGWGRIQRDSDDRKEPAPRRARPALLTAPEDGEARGAVVRRRFRPPPGRRRRRGDIVVHVVVEVADDTVGEESGQARNGREVGRRHPGLVPSPVPSSPSEELGPAILVCVCYCDMGGAK